METVYILYSNKIDKFYIGYTSNLETRMEFHKNAVAKKYTARANDWTIFHTIECQSKKQALAIEKHIKSMKSKVYLENLKKYKEISDKLKAKYKL